MSTLQVPYAREAERDLIGCCVDSDRGYRLAASRICADDFYRPANRQLFAACAQLGHLTGPSLEVLEQRIVEAARLADRPVDEVRRLVEDRPLQWDKNGTLAARVKKAADERRAQYMAVELANRLGQGEHLDRIAADLGPELRRLLAVAS